MRPVAALVTTLGGIKLVVVVVVVVVEVVVVVVVVVVGVVVVVVEGREVVVDGTASALTCPNTPIVASY